MAATVDATRRGRCWNSQICRSSGTAISGATTVSRVKLTGNGRSYAVNGSEAYWLCGRMSSVPALARGLTSHEAFLAVTYEIAAGSGTVVYTHANARATDFIGAGIVSPRYLSPRPYAHRKLLSPIIVRR